MAKVCAEKLKSGFYWCDLHFRSGSGGSKWIKDQDDQDAETVMVKQEVLEFVADEYDHERGFWMRAGMEENYFFGDYEAGIIPRHAEPLEVSEVE